MLSLFPFFIVAQAQMPLSPTTRSTPPVCSKCDAGTECGFCLQLVPGCRPWVSFQRQICGPDTVPGEWCLGDDTCGTDNPANSCFVSKEVYTRVDCVFVDPSPPPPRAPGTPVFDESAYLPAPPPPAVLVFSQETGGEQSGLDALSVPWLIVLIVWAVTIPCLLILVCIHVRRAEWFCWKKAQAGKAMAPVQHYDQSQAAYPSDLGYGGTLVADEQL